LRVFHAAIQRAGRKAFAMYSLFQDARDLLRERSMLGSRTAAK
jgi:hypothetical protein